MIIGLALALVALAAASPATATHLGSGLPDCVNTVAAIPASVGYDIGRLHVVGYAGGTIGGINLRIVDNATPNPVPDVFNPQGPPPVATELELAGALVSLSFPGLPNTFLLGGPPTTTVKESAFPLDPTTKVHAGAQTLLMTFSGRVRIYSPQSFTCESVTSPLLKTFTISKVDLDGFATAITGLDDADLEPWGLGLDIALAPGDTSNA
jgi:hypothetical protein